MIFEDSRGHLWFGTNQYGVMHFSGDTLRCIDEKDGLGGGRITEIIEDDQGRVWIGTAGGLSMYDGKSFINYNEDHGLANSEVWSVLIDRNGLFWIGTHEGVYRYNGNSFSQFSLPEMSVPDTNTILSYNRISSIEEDINGTIWFGTDGFGICLYHGQDVRDLPSKFSHLTTTSGLPDNNIADIMEDAQGDLWIGTMFGGVCRISLREQLKKARSFEYTNFTSRGDINGVEVGALYEDKKGNIWFAAEHEGVFVYDGTNFTRYNNAHGLNSNGILDILIDSKQRHWLGGWGGLFRMFPNRNGNLFESVTLDGPWEASD